MTAQRSAGKTLQTSAMPFPRRRSWNTPHASSSQPAPWHLHPQPPSPSTTPRPLPRPCRAHTEKGSTLPSFTKLGSGPSGEEYGSRSMSAPDGPVSLGLIRSPTANGRSIGNRVVFQRTCASSHNRVTGVGSDRGFMSSALFGLTCPSVPGSVQRPSERTLQQASVVGRFTLPLASDGQVLSLRKQDTVGPPTTGLLPREASVHATRASNRTLHGSRTARHAKRASPTAKE